MSGGEAHTRDWRDQRPRDGPEGSTPTAASSRHPPELAFYPLLGPLARQLLARWSHRLLQMQEKSGVEGHSVAVSPTQWLDAAKSALTPGHPMNE